MSMWRCVMASVEFHTWLWLWPCLPPILALIASRGRAAVANLTIVHLVRKVAIILSPFLFFAPCASETETIPSRVHYCCRVFLLLCATPSGVQTGADSPLSVSRTLRTALCSPSFLVARLCSYSNLNQCVSVCMCVWRVYSMTGCSITHTLSLSVERTPAPLVPAPSLVLCGRTRCSENLQKSDS